VYGAGKNEWGRFLEHSLGVEEADLILWKIREDLLLIEKCSTTAIVSVARVLTESSQAGSGARTFLITFGRLGAKTEQVGGY
jgi:hypothetical protein